VFVIRELLRLKQALGLAIEYYDSAIDSCLTTDYGKGREPIMGCVGHVKRWERDIRAYRKLIVKIKRLIEPKKGGDR
jgi:hypothetical protein